MNSTFSPGSAHSDKLQSTPIEPSWIIDGNPAARTLEVARCGLFIGRVWDCQAGTFFWHYETNEAVHILEGECIITDMLGGSRTLRAGDSAMFADGDWLHWYVPHYVRKYAVWGEPPKTVAQHALRKLGARASGLFARKRVAAEMARPALTSAMPSFRPLQPHAGYAGSPSSIAAE